MKKIIFVIPFILLCLVGCDDTAKNGTITCTLNTNDVVNGYQLQSTYKINYVGNLVNSVNTEEIVTSESDDFLTYFETTLNDTYKKTNEAYGGYEYNVIKKDGKVTSTVFIDYNNMNLEQFVNDQPTLKSYVKDGKLLVDGVKAMYETMGATCN